MSKSVNLKSPEAQHNESIIVNIRLGRLYQFKKYQKDNATFNYKISVRLFQPMM